MKEKFNKPSSIDGWLVSAGLFGAVTFGGCVNSFFNVSETSKTSVEGALSCVVEHPQGGCDAGRFAIEILLFGTTALATVALGTGYVFGPEGRKYIRQRLQEKSEDRAKPKKPVGTARQLNR